MHRLLSLVTALLLSTACINTKAESGVINEWRNPELPDFVVGATTQAEVVSALGPPSQLIALENGLVFYYMNQTRRVRGFFLVVYNQNRERISYDRAIYFFDQAGVLEDFALSREGTRYRGDGSSD